MEFGPVQILVIGFDEPEFKGQIRAELDRLRDHDVVRLVDLIVVRKDDDGNIERLHHSDLSQEEAEEFGSIAGALIGFGADGEEGMEAGAALGASEMEDGYVLDESNSWYVDDAIPPGTAAAVAILEHRWAIGLRDAIRDAGGFHLADAWVHPADLVAVGMLAKEEAAAR
jgi:uncharacterized membrane protein